MNSADAHAAAPLAEGRWLWRRVYVFGASFGLWLLLAAAVRAAPPEGLVVLARGLMGLQALLLVLYLVAPTAQQLVELLANLRLRLETGTLEAERAIQDRWREESRPQASRRARLFRIAPRQD